MIGKVLNNRYKIKNELGKGGMAIVYEAKDLLLDREVAIKMLRSEHVSDKNFIEKFHHEAKAVARLSHPNVVSIFDIGQDEDKHYLVMEDIKGKNLKDIIKSRGKIPIAEALDITNQILSALKVAHKKDIIHCDIKPHNILITPDKQVKVTDFGIAKAVSATTTMTDTIMGSANYFSPEQAKGGDIKAHSDLYSVGVVLYEMLTGEVPFKADSPISVALKHIKESATPPKEINEKIPVQLNDFILKALSKDPENRFQSAEKMRESSLAILQKLRRKKDSNSTIVMSDSGDTKILKKSEIKDKGQREENEKNNKNNKSNNETKSFRLSQNNEMSKGKKWLFWSGIIISIIAILGLLSFLIYKNYMEVPIVQVPDVEGMNFDRAKDTLSQVGLGIEEPVERVYHPEHPEDEVISQTPESGEMIKQTRNLKLTVSDGVEEISIPDIKGESLRKAELILENNKLEIGNKEFEYNEEVPENHIIEQKPESGETVNAGEKIELIVSKGVEPNLVEMPNLIGIKLSEAESIIKDNKLNIGNIKREKTKRFLEDQVVSQSFEADEEIPEDSKVDLTVSNGLANADKAKVHSINVNVNIRSDKERQVRIIVDDYNGEDVVYNKNHKPGDYISETINSVGKTTVEVYYDDELRHSKVIGD
ncbi:MAG: Stk1 family PASTA domain-containing Ser/Thr kinase [Bacillota bacterium]